MKVQKLDGSHERRILIGMVVDQVVLARISSKWDGSQFGSKWSNLIGGWCVEFFHSYGKSPGKAIQGMFEAWAGGGDDETIKLVESFLHHISGEYKQLRKDQNADYIIDIAGKLFSRVQLGRLADAISGNIDSGKQKKALQSVLDFSGVELGAGSSVDVMHDRSVWQAAFEAQQEPLVTYPGPLGRFFGNTLERDAFVSFMGPEKRGKSFWLLDVAWRSMLQRKRVAFFAVGDMSQNQTIRRLAARASNRPLRAKEMKFPTEISRDGDEQFAEVAHKHRTYKNPLEWGKAWGNTQKIMQQLVRSDRKFFKLSTHPAGSITVDGVAGIVRGWEREGWVPDVLVIDYADILAPRSGTADTRDQINSTWMQLRALSQSLHCLVVTATQSDAASYRTSIIDMQNFSDDKRKMAHVTAMIGLNQTEDEKSMDSMRLNFIVLREDAFSASRCVHVAGCRDIANVAVLSCF